MLAKPCFDPNDVENIVTRLLEAARNEAARIQPPRERLAHARQFTWDRRVRETLAVIERLQG